MPRPALELADIFAAHAPSFLKAAAGRISSAKCRVFRRIIMCRTSALGGHLQRCDQCDLGQCDYEHVAYNSCRDRHCPKCQAAARGEWLAAREARLLPVRYFHVVFTIPDLLAQIALQNKKVVYGALLRAAAETLLMIARDPKHLGARIGFLSVLHTWGQNLLHHPHVHCVVPGGGLSLDGKRWIASPKDFFLSVKVLARVFRGKLLDKIREAFADGKLQFQGELAALKDPRAFEQRLRATYKTNWVVYAKRPFGGPKQVLRYLARYTHRVAISNSRLISDQDGLVRFRWKDYRDGNRSKVMALDAHEFIRRFLLHVLPKGFQRIRYYGFLANRSPDFERCEALLGVHRPPPPAAEATPGDAERCSRRCPKCHVGRLVTRLLTPEELERRISSQTAAQPSGGSHLPNRSPPPNRCAEAPRVPA